MMLSKKIYTILALCLMAVVLPCSAQSYAEYTFNHEKDILGQFMVMEGVPVSGVSSSFYPTWYYTTFHKGYMAYAMTNNKQVLRLKATTDMEKEVAFSDTIQKRLTNRGLKEARKVADRKLDISLSMEQGRIQSKLDVFSRNISHIVAYGGTDKDYQYWKSMYSCFVKAVDCVHKAYMDNGQRIAEYKAIYADIIKHNNTLVGQLALWSSCKTSKNMLSKMEDSKALRFTSRKINIANVCKEKWGVVWGVDGIHNIKEDKSRRK